MRRNSNEKNMNLLVLRSVDENKQAPPLSKRPSDEEIYKGKKKTTGPFHPVSERKRLHNKIDPSLQEYLSG